jgi:hypothetical protein
MDQPFEMSQEHVRRTAAGMVAVHGREAERICQGQIDKMRRRKDAVGQRLWENVLAQLAGR